MSRVLAIAAMVMISTATWIFFRNPGLAAYAAIIGFASAPVLIASGSLANNTVIDQEED